MSTDAEFADARHVPPIPRGRPGSPRPRRTRTPGPPCCAGYRAPLPPRRPPGRAHPTGPTPPAGRPGTPPPAPRPSPASHRTPPAPPGTQPPPRPDRAPTPPAAPPPPAGRPAAFRDTAAFHLAHSQELWNAARGRTDGPDTPGREPAAAPAGEPPRPAADRPAPPWPGSHLPPQRAGARPGMPATPRAARRPPAAPAPGRWPPRPASSSASASSAVPRPELAHRRLRRRPAEPAGSVHHGPRRLAQHPVDTLFPRTVNGLGVGPGGADRTWTRIAVAPDSGCADAYDPGSPRRSPRPAAPACCAPPTSTPPTAASSPSARRPPEPIRPG
ncbi:hypothetical protein PQR15_29615 [Streptomyces lydicus]|nr:hypothetical protein [Streptomyces lydicus]